MLCPECVGRAGDNGFLRFRLKAALAERAAATRNSSEATSPDAVPIAVRPPGRSASVQGPVAQDPRASQPVTSPATSPASASGDAEMLAYYEARAGEYDDWYLRRGRYSHGPIQDMAWQQALDEATLWLDALPWRGEIVELAAGTGWWSPLLAQKGELSIFDAADAPLDRARERLVAHRLKAHIHVRDAWEEPDRPVDGLFTGFWLSHVPRARLGDFLRLVRGWLKPGGMFAFIDSRPDPYSGAVDHDVPPAPDMSLRRLSDGRTFTIPKVFYEPDELESALTAAGFAAANVKVNRFFLMGHATA